MIFSASLFAAAISVIPIDGVKCTDLSVRADFDTYNVYEGDPMTLTVDFIGNADFRSIHPPEISGAVDPAVWKVDEKSAKTDTYRDARRITYRVRPLKVGCLEFPSLTFSYKHYHTGKTVEVSTSPIPVHSKKTSQVVFTQDDKDDIPSMPLPDGLFVDLSESPWGSCASFDEDELFAWRKACIQADAAAFRRFDIPEARLNEAACEILAGNWRRALSIYHSIEWTIGQTVTVERGIVAAMALKTSDKNIELPVWRQILRPVLRHSWKGRSLYAIGALLAVAVIICAARAILKLIVCLAVAVFLSQSASAIDPFDEIRRMQEEMRREMTSMGMGLSGAGTGMTVNGVDVDRIAIKAEISSDKTELTVGETFNLIVSLDTPKDCTLSGIRLNPSRPLGLAGAGESESLPDLPGSDTNRVVKRISVPLRYDVPFAGPVLFSVNGMCDRIVSARGFRSSFSTSFSAESNSVVFEVKPLDGTKTPRDYNGCIGEGFTAFQRIDVHEVETNDVVAVTVTVRGTKSFIPDNAFADQLGRERNTVVFKRLFRACGESATPDVVFSYYNPSEKDFRRVVAKGVPLKYVMRAERDDRTVVIGSSGDAIEEPRKVFLKFAPRENARDMVSTMKRGNELTVTETCGEWVRVDDGVHAGWIRKRDLK